MDESISTKKPLIKHDWNKEDYIEYRRKLCRESQKKRRQKAKEEGKCVICVRNLAEHGYSTCAECLARIKKSQKRRTK